MKDKKEILDLLKKAESEKQGGNIEVAINTLEEAKNLLLNVYGSQRSNRNDTSGDEKEIIYLHKYANILYGIEEYKQSSSYYEEIVRKQPKPKVNMHKALGDCFRKLNEYDKALKQYNESLKAYKNDRSASSEDKAAVHNSIGLTYVVKSQNEDALKAFEEAINVRTKNPNPLYYCNKGSILLGITGKKEEGLNCFNEAVTLVNKGKIEGLTNQNIYYITEILDPYVKLENKVKGIQGKFEEIQSKKVDAEQWHEFLEKYNKLQEDNNKLTEIVRDHILKQEAINSLSEEHNTESTKRINQLTTDIDKLQHDVQVVKEGLQVATEDIADAKTHLDRIDSELRQTLKNYSVVLEYWLKSSGLSGEDKIKITEYYNAFVGTIASTYTAAQVINSEWVESKKSLIVSLLSGAISSAVPGGMAAAKAVELIEAPLSAAISGIASLVGKGIEEGGNFAVSRSIKLDARKVGKLASSPIGMNNQVSEEAMEIVKNEDKQKQILTVTLEDLNKLPDGSLKKIKKCLYEIPKEKIDEFFYGAMYSTAAERLGNKDANTLIKKYLKTNLDAEHQAAFKAAAQDVREDCRVQPVCELEKLREEFEAMNLHVESVDINDNIAYSIITKLCERAAKGVWTTGVGLSFHKPCSKLFDEKEYLPAKLKILSQGEILPEQIKAVQILMFKYMCTAIVNSDKKDEACITGFAKKYPELVKKIANEHPEYFINEQMVKAAITTDSVLQQTVLDKLNEMEMITGSGIGEYEYEEGSYHKYWYEYSKQAMDTILKLCLKSTGIENVKSVSIDYAFNEFNKLYFAKDLRAKITSVFSTSNDSNNITKLLIPINLYNKHWVGVMIEHGLDQIIAYYMDSEGEHIPETLKNSIENALVKLYPNLHIEIIEQPAANQKYNNCGPEVIENLVASCGVPRIAEDEALASHSSLLEQFLLGENLGLLNMY